MLRSVLKTFSSEEIAEVCRKVGTSEQVLKMKYLPPTVNRRHVPRRARFERILQAVNEVRPGSLSREQLAAYVYEQPEEEEGKAA